MGGKWFFVVFYPQRENCGYFLILPVGFEKKSYFPD
jgi:hypothetical protein